MNDFTSIDIQAIHRFRLRLPPNQSTWGERGGREENKDLNDGILEEILSWNRQAKISIDIDISVMMSKIKKEPITRAERGRNETQKQFHDGGNQEEHKVCRDWSLLAALPPFVSWTLWISRSTRWGHHSLPTDHQPSHTPTLQHYLSFRTESMKMVSTYDLLQYSI